MKSLWQTVLQLLKCEKQMDRAKTLFPPGREINTSAFINRIKNPIRLCFFFNFVALWCCWLQWNWVWYIKGIAKYKGRNCRIDLILQLEKKHASEVWSTYNKSKIHDLFTCFSKVGQQENLITFLFHTVTVSVMNRKRVPW